MEAHEKDADRRHDVARSKNHMGRLTDSSSSYNILNGGNMSPSSRYALEV